MTTAPAVQDRATHAPVVGAWGDTLAGMRAMAPMLLAYAPFGLLVGAAVAESDQRLAAWLSTWTIYGGAAHLAVLDVLQHDGGVAGAAMVGLLLNARMVAYSVSLAPLWGGATVASRIAAALMLTDAVWGLSHSRGGSAGSRAYRSYYFGAGVVLWLGWPTLVTLGVVMGGRLAAVPGTTLLPALTLGYLAVGQLRTRPGLAAGSAAAVVAAVTSSMDTGVALALSAAAGTAAAVAANRRLP